MPSEKLTIKERTKKARFACEPDYLFSALLAKKIRGIEAFKFYFCNTGLLTLILKDKRFLQLDIKKEFQPYDDTF